MEQDKEIVKEFIKYESLLERLQKLLRSVYKEALENHLEEEDEGVTVSEEDAENWMVNTAISIVEDFNTYVHGDTNIPGCLMDIRVNWNIDHNEPANSDCFKKAIEDIDLYYERLENDVFSGCSDTVRIDHESRLQIFQKYAIDWFFEAFETYGLTYNFTNFIME